MSRKLIAILRGITPDEVLDIVHVIVKAGISLVEVPLNSPRAFASIRLLHDEFSDSIQVGAGTVTDTEQVKVLSEINVDFIVSPNFDPDVVSATKEADILSYPGVVTPTECFAALKCGADGLKLFPASLIGEENLIALRAVLPAETPVFMVGGVGPDNFSSWIKAGATGFGIGSGLYKAGDSSEVVSEKAISIVSAYDEAQI